VVAVWGVVMWAATVALNQHYVVDLLAGAVVAAAAYAIATRVQNRER
jgi:membrane-associated phospholipid phosphatase